MLRRFFAVFFLLFFLIIRTHSQTKGILPFTGIKYFSEGISVKNIEIKVDGLTLVSNRIPFNREFEVRVVLPAGFTEDKSKLIFAAAEMNIASMKGDIVSKIPNIFKDNEAKGFASAAFKELTFKFTLKPEMIKADVGCTIKLRYYDLKGKNQLRVEFPVTIAKPTEMLMTSKLINDIKSTAGSSAKAIGVKAKNVDITIDTTIRVNPKMAYASLDITNIEGTSISEVLSGKESYWVYDENLNQISMTDKQLKQVGGAMENNVVNYLSKIPYRLKTVSGKIFYVRFRWESTDKRKIIDIVLTK